MKKFNIRPFIFPGTIGLLVVMAAFLFADCTGGGGGGDGSNSSPSDADTYVISAGGLADNIDLVAGQTTSHSFIGTTPGPKRTYNAITLNLQEILDAGYLEANQRIQVTPDDLSHVTSAMQKAPIYQWQVSLRFGTSADLNTICEDGWLYGPYTVTGTEKPETFDTASVSAEPSTVDLINFGTFAMCIEISSPIDLTLSIKNYSVDVTTCDEDPENFAGTWVGTYSCEYAGGEECSENETDQPITLWITQEGHSAQYTDDVEASFEGTVCGNEFAFNGGIEGPGGYIEKGKFVLQGNGTLTKEASFISNDGVCTGTCWDVLERQTF